MTPLDRPSLVAVLTQWTVQPVAIVLAAALVLAYATGLRALRRAGRAWPRWRVAVFAAGIVLLVWGSSGFPQVYAGSLFWVWTSQTLLLWLGVPVLVLSGHPVQLARAVRGADGPLERALRTRPARVIANPLVGPALVPVLSGVLFFGPLAGWAVASAPVGWLLQLVLLAVGALMVLPLVGLDEDASSLAVGLALAIGSIELVIDALPGVILRLRTTLGTTWFDHRQLHVWTPEPLRDQQVAGAVLWCIAELIDLPFLFLVYRRWLRADARDAAQIDAVLEAERAARAGIDGERGTESDGQTDARPDDRDVPWWLSDPAMRERLRNQAD